LAVNRGYDKLLAAKTYIFTVYLLIGVLKRFTRDSYRCTLRLKRFTWKF